MCTMRQYSFTHAQSQCDLEEKSVAAEGSGRASPTVLCGQVLDLTVTHTPV